MTYKEFKKGKDSIINIFRKIENNSKTERDYGTGMIGEALIVSSYKAMTIENLEKMRIIINKIIKEKKEHKRMREKNDIYDINLHNNADNSQNNEDKP